MTGGPPPRPPVWANIEQGWTNDPAGEARFAVESVCFAARLPPDWTFEGQPLRIDAVTSSPGTASIEGTCAGSAFRLDLTARDDGWVEGLLVVATVAVLRFFLERPWEEYEFYPPGHDGVCEPYESPGRLGKKLSWGQIHASAWPALGLTGYLGIEAVFSGD
jgi:hypothetical protein